MLTLANKLHVADPKKVKIWSKEDNKQYNVEVEKNTRITSLYLHYILKLHVPRYLFGYGAEHNTHLCKFQI